MLHRFLAAIAVLLFMPAIATSADAGSRADYICWTGLNGSSDCANLPARWSIPGVRVPVNRAGRVSFTLTRTRIAALSRYIDVENIRPSYQATLYSRRGRGIYRSRRRTAVRGFARRKPAVRSFARRQVAPRRAVRSFQRRSVRRASFFGRRHARRAH